MISIWKLDLFIKMSVLIFFNLDLYNGVINRKLLIRINLLGDDMNKSLKILAATAFTGIALIATINTAGFIMTNKEIDEAEECGRNKFIVAVSNYFYYKNCVPLVFGYGSLKASKDYLKTHALNRLDNDFFY